MIPQALHALATNMRLLECRAHTVQSPKVNKIQLCPGDIMAEFIPC